MPSDIRYVRGRFPRLVPPGGGHVLTGNAVDAMLVARIAAHDRAAMRILYTRHHARIRRFVRRFADGDAAADDLVHEVFLDVWRYAGRYAGHAPVSAWLIAIARHAAVLAQPRDGRPMAVPWAP